MPSVAADKSDVIARIPAACAIESAAVEFMEQQRWGDTAACPRCGDTNVYQMRDRESGEREKNFRWRCRGCKKQYTVRTGTVLEESRIPLRHWCYAFWRASTSKKGVSALEIKRHTGLSYKSALFMMHRIRYAMAPANASEPPLSGTVEVDETYVGGKPRNRQSREAWRKGGKKQTGRGTKKTPVMAMVERGGGVRARVVTDVSAATLQGAIREMVDPSARIMTDEWRSYRGIGDHFEGGHFTVKHRSGQYVNGEAYTNSVEGFFSLLKRGMYGTFHSVSKQHLHRYVAEFEFRYNARELEDGERTTKAIQGADGKRLRYREPMGSGAE